MKEAEIFEAIKELDKIIDPAQCNSLSSHINGYIMDYEEELHTLNLQISNEWLNIRKSVKSTAQADRELEVTPLYQRRERIKLTMAQLKRIRSDLKDRFIILTNIPSRKF